VFLYFRFYIYNCDKFITLTVSHCECMAKTNHLYGVCLKSYNNRFWHILQNKFRSCCLCVFLLLHSFLLSLSWNSPHSSWINYRIHCLSSWTFLSLSSLSGLSVYWDNIFIKMFLPLCTINASVCKITEAKTKDGAIGTFPTQRPFQGFILNSCDNIPTLHHTLWWYIFTSDILAQLFFSCIF